MTPLFGVSDFLASVNQTLEYAYTMIQVEGEVASYKVNQGKFVFFDLKDSDGTVGCFMTVWQLKTPIEDGMKIVVTATPKITPWGKFSLTVQSLRPSGEGALKKSFELLRAKLEKEGLFAPERKRALPAIPKRVGVISSTQSAGYADFIKILGNRWGGMQVDVAHVQVQGDVAADQIVRAIDFFGQQPDVAEVLVIIRGGGSADDLAAFNDESLVRAVAASRIPTLVGVGHETDVSLADMVADVRAATPSNAAQLLVPDRKEILGGVRQQMRTMASAAEYHIDALRVDTRKLVGAGAEYAAARIDDALASVESQRSVLRAYDPSAVLARGYALVRGEIDVGKLIEIETLEKLITAEVSHVKTVR